MAKWRAGKGNAGAWQIATFHGSLEQNAKGENGVKLYDKKIPISRAKLEKRVAAFMNYHQKTNGIFVDWFFHSKYTLEICSLGTPEGSRGLGSRFMYCLVRLAEKYGFSLWIEELPAKGWSAADGMKKTRSTKATREFYEAWGFFDDDFEGMEHFPLTFVDATDDED